MSTITKERIEQYANDPRMCNVNDEIRQIALIALASLEAEAVGEVVLGEYDDCGCHPYARVACIAADGQADWENFKDGTRLYTAPPAPVSVPDAMEMDDDFDSAFEHGKAVGWNAYRAAMLQGADRPQNEPQNIPENIPATQFKPVADLYGLTSPTGGETSFTFDAVEARDFIDGGWSCQEYVELGRYQEALTDHSEGDLDMVRPVMFIDGNLLPGDAEKLKAAIEEFNHSGEPTIMIAGNSPVIPDEVLSAIRKVARIRTDFDHFDGDRRGIGDCLDEAEQELIVTINKYASQLAAEPIATNDVREQTAIPQVPVTPNGWISCSERMPDKLIPVIVMYEDGEMWSAMWNGNRWDDGTEYPDPHSVTHWSEMPAAPQQEVNHG